MKDQLLEKLRALEQRLRTLKTSTKKLQSKRVSRKPLLAEAEAIADLWVEEVRSPLEHRFKLASDVIGKYADAFKKLHILSRPNNLVFSYASCIDGILKDFKDDLVLHVQQSQAPTAQNPLTDILSKVSDTDTSDYLDEAVACAGHEHYRAAIIMGWCAAIDHVQRKLMLLGLQKFNAASVSMKAQTSGRFKKFNQQFACTTLGDLQEVFDTNLLQVLEGMQLIDGNQGDRLRTCLGYRNQSAHPGKAPVLEPHLKAFFTDLVEIIFTNPQLALTP